jgi:hypothetical protein
VPRADGCRYSSQKIVSISDDTNLFYLNVFSGNQDFTYSSGFWERFTPEFVDIESPANTSWAFAISLQQRV